MAIRVLYTASSLVGFILAPDLVPRGPWARGPVGRVGFIPAPDLVPRGPVGPWAGLVSSRLQIWCQGGPWARGPVGRVGFRTAPNLVARGPAFFKIFLRLRRAAFYIFKSKLLFGVPRSGIIFLSLLLFFKTLLKLL